MLEGRAGWAKLDCAITAAGTTQDCKVTGASAPDFAAAALDFTRHARYSPAMRDGVAVEQKHHTFTINYTLPPQTIRTNVVCGVQASGKVHDCRLPADIAKSALGRGLQSMLERMTVTPIIRDGRPMADPDRTMTVQMEIVPLPVAEPLTPLSGDIVSEAIMTCHPASGPQKRCVIDRARSETPEQADTAQFQIEMAISGVVPPQTGDFSQ